MDIITWVSVAIIVAAFFIAWGYIAYQKKNGNLLLKRRWIDQLPSLISTLGVLGTFAGITIGLWFFDTHDLNQSIPKLLSGLKTAFFTSLAGMIGSLILSKTVNSSFDENDGGVSDINQAAGEICRAVRELKEQISKQSHEQSSFYPQALSFFEKMKENMEEQRERASDFYPKLASSLEKVDKNTEGLKDFRNDFQNLSSLVSGSINRNLSEMLDAVSGGVSVQNDMADEIKKFSNVLRGEVDEIEDKMESTNRLLSSKFDEFSELLRKSNTEALVEVMKKVTEEFQTQMNALISKLVQENFEQLNNSVERLNAWQQENKETIASLTRQYKDMADSFEGTSAALESVGNNAKELVGDGGKLQQIVDALSQVMIEDEKFVEITSNLSGASELTRQNMEQFSESTKALNNWVRKQRNFVDGVQQLIEKLDELNKMRDYGEQFWQGTKRNLEEGVGFISKGSKALNDQLKKLDEQFYARLNTTLAGLDACIQAMINGNSRRPRI